MNEEENQAFKILHFYNSEDYGTEELKKYIKIIVNLVEKQQKEIKARLEEIDSLYKMMSVKDERIRELREFKKEVIDIIKYADDTAEPTYWNIRKLLGLGE